MDCNLLRHWTQNDKESLCEKRNESYISKQNTHSILTITTRRKILSTTRHYYIQYIFMNKMAPQEFGYANLFLTEEAQYPHILPHHLFVLVAAKAASKEYVCLFVDLLLLLFVCLFFVFILYISICQTDLVFLTFTIFCLSDIWPTHSFFRSNNFLQK